jgi:hypothetical protein
MHAPCGDIELGPSRYELKTRFSSVFKQKLRQLLSHHGSAAVEFGIVWQQSLDQVPLDELDQAEVYWELIDWTKAASYSQRSSARRSTHSGDSRLSIRHGRYCIGQPTLLANT